MTNIGRFDFLELRQDIRRVNFWSHVKLDTEEGEGALRLFIK